MDYIRRFGVLAGIILSVVPARADPIELPEKSITPEISFIIAFAILLEVICIWLILRRFRRPHFFILWLIVDASAHISIILGLALVASRHAPGFCRGQ